MPADVSIEDVLLNYVDYAVEHVCILWWKLTIDSSCICNCGTL